ncbi:AMP-binding protein, partial [Mesorhizobium mediterraneum]|uniref:AMP-binding protein n=1 Tax=Mesorhizobium mediterraneum TaxID=43617 RepID=UPI00177B10D0
VAVPHRAVVNCFHAFHALLDIDQDQEWLALTSIGFDIAALELLLPLTLGARVRITSLDRIVGPGGMCAVPIDAPIVQTTPYNWDLILRSGSLPPGAKALCGGEALPRRLAQQLARSTPAAWNVYGPTETTIWSTAWRIDSDRVTIGQPILNTSL